jgi:hypothetical protein
MKEYEIWSEGFAATGESSDATFEGKEWGNTFEEAVIKKLGYRLDKDSENPDGYRRFGGKLCIWACRFFDNEKEARASFG